MSDTLLVVHPSQTLQRAIQLALCKTPFHVLTTTNPQEAKALLATHPLALILVDQDTWKSGLLPKKPHIATYSPNTTYIEDDNVLLLKIPFLAETLLETVHQAKQRASIQQPVAAQPSLMASSLSKEELSLIAKQAITEIAWEVVPQIAERMIEKELKRLLENQPPS